MRNTFPAVAAGLIAATLASAAPANAFGPGGLARGLAQSPAIVAGAAALPETAASASPRYCAAFGACIGGRSIALRASWRSDRDAVAPLDRLTLTSIDVERALSAARSQISPFITPEEPSVDYGILTGSVPGDLPL